MTSILTITITIPCFSSWFCYLCMHVYGIFVLRAFECNVNAAVQYLLLCVWCFSFNMIFRDSLMWCL